MQGKKKTFQWQKILKTLKISGPYSVVLGNHITIKLPHDSHIPSLLKILAHKRDKVSLHKMMGTWGCHHHPPSISNHFILLRPFYFYQHLLLMASDDFLITIINAASFQYKMIYFKKRIWDFIYIHTHTHTHTHKMKYYLAIKKKGITPFTATWMDPEMIILSQTKTNIWHQLYKQSQEKNDTNELIYKTEIQK